MNELNIIATILGLVTSIITLIAVWGNISAIYRNWRNFRKGGWRTTYQSGAYSISVGSLGDKVIYRSSNRKEDYICYRGEGMFEHIEDIKPFKDWERSHWIDDIRVPNYPINLL